MEDIGIPQSYFLKFTGVMNFLQEENVFLLHRNTLPWIASHDFMLPTQFFAVAVITLEMARHFR
jgi:hypothetical protein